MIIDSVTGLIEWIPSPAQVGTHQVPVVATDLHGSQGILLYSLKVLPNDVTLTINSLPVETVVAGLVYRYDVKATDTGGADISYRLQTAPDGMLIDSLGRITWATGIADIGPHSVEVIVSNDRGTSRSQSYQLTVTADTQQPRVLLQVSSNPADLGSDVTFVVSATDNVAVARIGLTVNGLPVAIDARGRATVTLTQAGTVTATATAADAAGNTVLATRAVLVIDRSDAEAPIVTLTSPANEAVITSPVDVIGTVDDAALLSYVIEAIPFAGGPAVVMARGTNSVVNGVLGKFDPSRLQNDTYILRLTARDAGNHVAKVERRRERGGGPQAGELPAGLRRPAVPVSGVPITVVRTYDTQLVSGSNRGRLRLAAGVPASQHPHQCPTHLRRGQRHLQPLPRRNEGLCDRAGRQTGRVHVQARGQSRFLQSTYGFVDFIYSAKFEPDPGVTSTLEVPEVYLLLHQRRLLRLRTQRRARTTPADPIHGGSYTLTTKEGIAYQIDARSGLLDVVRDPNANTLSFSAGGIISSTGKKITFERDPQGRIIAITDPMGDAGPLRIRPGGGLGVRHRPREQRHALEYRTSPGPLPGEGHRPVGPDRSTDRVRRPWPPGPHVRRLVTRSSWPTTWTTRPRRSSTLWATRRPTSMTTAATS